LRWLGSVAASAVLTGALFAALDAALEQTRAEYRRAQEQKKAAAAEE
jgi:hypothetical protein